MDAYGVLCQDGEEVCKYVRLSVAWTLRVL